MKNSKQVAKILLSKKLTDEEKGERLRNVASTRGVRAGG
jgi:hypothetical protein